MSDPVLQYSLYKIHKKSQSILPLYVVSYERNIQYHSHKLHGKHEEHCEENVDEILW